MLTAVLAEERVFAFLLSAAVLKQMSLPWESIVNIKDCVENYENS
jgi:hypothetical protein